MDQIERDERLCKYNGNSCPNERAMDRHGDRPLRFCGYHLGRAAGYQARYLERLHRPQLPPSPRQAQPVALPMRMPVAAAPAAVPAVAPPPLLLVVFASETDVPAALQRLASAGHFRFGPQFPAIPSDAIDLLRSIMDGEPQAPLETTAAMEIEPLPFQIEPANEATTAFTPDDVERFNGLFW